MVQQPSTSAVNGVAFLQQPTVQVRDALGNPVPGVRSVTVAIATGGGTLGGSLSVSTDANGLATFAGLSITGPIGARTLQFSSTGLTAATSTGVTVTPGAATQLTMVQQPSATAQNAIAFAQQPTVQVRDISGNAVPGMVSVTAAIATGTGTLGGMGTVNTDANGLATFAGLSITGTVGARTLQFTSGALTAATSTAVNVTAGAASQLVVLQQPSLTAANGAVFAQQPTVQVRDASGNPVTGTTSVTATILTGGGTLGGTTTVSTGGTAVATFAGLSITGTIGSRTLQFTSTGLTGATSTAINLTAGAATQLVMVQQPSASAANGAVFAQQPTVQAQDASGNNVAGIRSVAVALVGGGLLGGTTPVSTDGNGLATFAGLSVTGTIGSRTLQFTSAGLTAATSTAINLTAGAATQLVMVQQPSASAANGAVFAQQPTVQAQDASGNNVAGDPVGGGGPGGWRTTRRDDAGEYRWERPGDVCRLVGDRHDRVADAAVHERGPHGGHLHGDQHHRRGGDPAGDGAATLGVGGKRGGLRAAADGAGAGRLGESGPGVKLGDGEHPDRRRLARRHGDGEHRRDGRGDLCRVVDYGHWSDRGRCSSPAGRSRRRPPRRSISRPARRPSWCCCSSPRPRRRTGRSSRSSRRCRCRTPRGIRWRGPTW